MEAIQKRGLEVGLYDSLVNWRWHAFWDPEHYANELATVLELEFERSPYMLHDSDASWLDGKFSSAQ